MLRPSPNHGTQRLPNDDDDPKRPPSLEGSHALGYPNYKDKVMQHLIQQLYILSRCNWFVIIDWTC